MSPTERSRFHRLLPAAVMLSSILGQACGTADFPTSPGDGTEVGGVQVASLAASGASEGPESRRELEPRALRGNAGGNSAAAHRCQLEWQSLKTVDGEGFRNVGQCVSYAARGGEFAPPPPELDFRGYCESVGGRWGTEFRQGVPVAVCTPSDDLPLDQAEALAGYCDGILTTEVRSGILVFICTPTE